MSKTSQRATATRTTEPVAVAEPEPPRLPEPVVSPGWAPGGARMVPLAHLQAILAALPVPDAYAGMPLWVYPNPKGDLMVCADRGAGFHPRGVVVGNIDMRTGSFQVWRAYR